MKVHQQIEAFGEQDRDFRSGYSGECLLKDILPAESCSGLVQNHIIGREFLKQITSRDNQILYWDIFSGKAIAIQSMGNNKIPGEKSLEDIRDFRPSKVGIDNIRCQTVAACNRHDHKAFELIETPAMFNAHDPSHQARMGMRAAFLEAAFLSNSEAWIRPQRFVHRAILIEWTTLNGLRDTSLKRLKTWINAVTDRKTTEIYTKYTEQRLPIRIAVCGTVARLGAKSPSTISLMPRSDGMTDILISSLDSEFKGRKTPQQDKELELLSNLIGILKEKPSEGIQQLLRVTDQIFINPDDYENRSVVSEAQKAALEVNIAGYRAKEYQRVTQAAGVQFGRKGKKRG